MAAEGGRRVGTSFVFFFFSWTVGEVVRSRSSTRTASCSSKKAIASIQGTPKITPLSFPV
jgi:hypothetical protein